MSKGMGVYPLTNLETPSLMRTKPREKLLALSIYFIKNKYSPLLPPRKATCPR